MIGVSDFGLTHQTSTITPSTPALFRAIRLARRARGLLTVFNIVIESKGSMIYTGTGPCKFNSRGVSSLWELRSRQRVRVVLSSIESVTSEEYENPMQALQCSKTGGVIRASSNIIINVIPILLTFKAATHAFQCHPTISNYLCKSRPVDVPYI
jgi:hypothetical protein